MARPGPQTQAKRQRERAKREKREAKAEKRAMRKEQKARDAEGDDTPEGVDPDIAGIVPGPHNRPPLL